MADRKRSSAPAVPARKRTKTAEGAAPTTPAAPAASAAAAAAAPAPTDASVLRLFACGQNCFGQLGLGSEVDEKKRANIVESGELKSKNVASVSAGGMHSLAVTADGQAITWGCGDDHCLGRALPDEDSEFVPTHVDGMPEPVAAGRAGDNYTVLLGASGRVYMAGTFRDSKGILGFSSTVEKQPTFACIFPGGHERAVALETGCNHVVFLTNKGRVFTFGVGEQGQLGRIDSAFLVHNEQEPTRELRGHAKVKFLRDVTVSALNEVLLPKPVSARGMNKVKKIFAGSWSTVVIDVKNHIWGWGLNNYAQLGFKFQNPEEMMVFKPRRLPHWEALNIVQFAFGQHHTVALSADGKVYSVGRGDMGRLGLGNTTSFDTPQHVAGLAAHKIVEISCANCNSYAVSDAGQAFAWGFGENHQLGTGTDEDALLPAPITAKALEGAAISHVCGGGQHTLLLAALPTAPAAASGAAPKKEDKKKEEENEEEEEGEEDD